MLWFFFRYIVWITILYLLFFIDSFSPFYWLNTLQTELTIYLTATWIELFEIPVQMLGNTVYLDHGFDVWIFDECNGLTAFLIFGTAIIAYPTLWKSRLYWLLEGYVFVVVLNMIRIDAVVYFTMLDANYFHISHNLIGRYSTILLTLSLFFIFTLRVSISQMVRQRCDRRKQAYERRHPHAKEWRADDVEHRHLPMRRKSEVDRRNLLIVNLEGSLKDKDHCLKTLT